MPQVSPSVLIIRLDAIGDALALTPLLAALRDRSIPVDLVLRPGNAAIFSSRAARRIVESPFDLRSNGPDTRAAIAALGRELARRRYSHVLVATEDPGGYRLARATGAAVRIGFANGWGKPFKTLWSRAFLTRSIYRSAGLDRRAPHECDVLFGLGSLLVGAEPPTRERAALRSLVLEREPLADDRIAVQITDKWQRLGIAFDEVIELVRRIAAFGPPRLLAAAAEDDYADAVARASGIEVETFTSLEPWKQAVGAAPAIVAPDSGALHVAGTIGTPVVGVFPPTREFALQVARWAPWAAPHRIVRAEDGWPLRACDAVAQLIV